MLAGVYHSEFINFFNLEYQIKMQQLVVVKRAFQLTGKKNIVGKVCYYVLLLFNTKYKCLIIHLTDIVDSSAPHISGLIKWSWWLQCFSARRRTEPSLAGRSQLWGGSKPQWSLPSSLALLFLIWKGPDEKTNVPELLITAGNDLKMDLSDCEKVQFFSMYFVFFQSESRLK